MNLVHGSSLRLGFHWAEAFQKTADELKRSEDVLERVRSLEREFWKYFVVCCVVTLWGIVTMFASRQVQILGLFLALTGLITSAVIKLAVQIRLSLLWLLWEQRKREEDELRRSMAEDL